MSKTRSLKYIWHALLIIILLGSGGANAAELIATISSRQINAGQPVVLRLVLADAMPSAPPDLSPLLQDFRILAQQQFSSYSSLNGQVSAESGWDITIAAKQEGKVTIPSISVPTNAGVLRSAPINLGVDKASTQSTSHDLGISIAAAVTKNSTYVQEPIIYTMKIISYQPWVSRNLVEIKSNDAIIEKIAEPKQYYRNYGGMHANIVEIKYYITPMVAGKIKISAPMIQGEIQSPRYSSMFDYQPFTIKGEAITITAKPAPISGKGWLPLQDLQLSEEWEGLDHAKEGDTIIRKIKMVARGGFSSQLPELQQFQEIKDLKIYANKPLTQDTVDPKTDMLIGTKELEYSMVPRHGGTFTLPEIKIEWWNLRTNARAVATLPARKFKVTGISKAADQVVSDQPDSAAVADPQISNNKLLYWIIGLLAVMVAMLLGLLCLVWKRRASGASSLFSWKFHRNNPRHIRDAFTLKTHIIQHAQKKWRVPANINLHDLPDYLLQNGYQIDVGAYATLSQELNAALYNNSNAALPSLIEQWLYVRKNVVKNSKLRRGGSKTKPLNPT